MQQCVSVLVEQCPGKVSCVRSITDLNEQLDIDEALLFTVALRVAVRSLRLRTMRTMTPSSSAASVSLEMRSPALPAAAVSSSGSGSPSVWETSNTGAGLNPTSPSSYSYGGVSSYSQPLSSWYRCEFSHSGHYWAMIGAQIQIACSPSLTCRSNFSCHVQ